MKLTLSNIALVIARANGHPEPEVYAEKVVDEAAKFDAESQPAPAPTPAPAE